MRIFRKAITHPGILLAIFFGIYYFFYLQGVPYELDDVLPSYSLLKHVSYPELLVRIFSPISYTLQSDKDLDFIFVRITECLFYKHLLADHYWRIFFYNLLMNSFFIFLIYQFARKIMDSRLDAFLCVIVLMTTPAYGWNTLELGDSTPTDQVFLILYLWAIIYQFVEILKNENYRLNSKKLLNFFGTWVLAMLCVRIKESNLAIVPIFTTLMVLFHPGFNLRLANQNQRKGLWFILLIGLYCFLPMVFVNHRGSSAIFSEYFNLKNLYDLIVQNPSGWEKETVPVLFRLNRQYPTSILSMFGFGLSWLFIFSGLALIFLKDVPRKEVRRSFSTSFFLASWIASTCVIFLFHRAVAFSRHLTPILLPFGFLFFYVFIQLANRIPNKARIFFLTLLTLITLWSVSENLRHSMYIRQELGKIWGMKWAFREAIFEDQMGRKPNRMFELHQYWSPPSPYIWEMSKFLDGRSDLPDFSPGSPFSKMMNEYPTMYLASYQNNVDTPWRETMIFKTKPLDASILLRFLGRWKHQDFTFYLYRVEK